MTPAEARAEINRANSQHSTGPKTPEGKKRISLNALRHGLTGQIVVMPTEDLQAYQRHLQSFTDEYNPKGATESHLVQALADASWRLNRVAAMESNLLSLQAVLAPDSIAGAVSIAAALESQSKAFSNLSMHSQRLSRQFERTVTQLRELQKIRKDQEEMQEDKGEPHTPAKNGFVFSEAPPQPRNSEKVHPETLKAASDSRL